MICRLEAEVTDKNSDYLKVTLILLCATLSASIRYSNPEFMQLLLMAREMLKPFMNVLNAKHLQTFILYLGTSLKNSLNFQRLNVLFGIIAEMMNKDLPENKSYYLNVLNF